MSSLAFWTLWDDMLYTKQVLPSAVSVRCCLCNRVLSDIKLHRHDCTTERSAVRGRPEQTSTPLLELPDTIISGKPYLQF